MARSLPPLTWFRAFEASARNLSFTGAAQELGLTQSAISQQVHALEVRLGCLLFERKSRGLALTDDGRRLAPTVADAIGALRSATDSFDSGARQDVLTVATSVSIAQWYIVPRLEAFSAAHPNAAIRLMTKVWPDEFSKLSVDVEIRFDSLASARPASKILGTKRVGLVATPGLVGAVPSEGLSEKDIVRHPLIQVVGTADTWQDWAQSRSFSSAVRPSLFVESYGMAVDLARSKAGIALVDMMIAAPSMNEGKLVKVVREEQAASDGYHLSVNAGVNSDLSNEFAIWLLNEVAMAEQEAAGVVGRTV